MHHRLPLHLDGLVQSLAQLHVLLLTSPVQTHLHQEKYDLEELKIRDPEPDGFHEPHLQDAEPRKYYG